MNYLKIKFGLFSLLAMLAVSVFLTSCEQENILDDVVTEIDIETIEADETFQLTIPNGMSEEDMTEWLDNLSPDELTTIGEAIGTNEVENRGCTSWSPWRKYHTSVSCSGCGSPPAQHTHYYYRYRYCNGNPIVSTSSYFTCHTYC